MTKRKIPLRMCVGCREQRDKRELLRVVRTLDGEVVVDRTGKKPGRGAYICFSGECLKKAMKSRALERALEIKMSEEIVRNIEECISLS